MKIDISTYEFLKHKPPILLQITDFWVIADLHLGHRNILEYEPCRRDILQELDTIHHMNSYLIHEWNSVVKDNDTVLLLGDVSLCGADRTIELVNQLKGHKILVRGNHDKSRSIMFWKRLFVDVYDCPLKIGEFIYSHEPVSLSYLEENNANLNIHGHIHSKYIDNFRYKCVSVEQIDYKPTKVISDCKSV